MDAESRRGRILEMILRQQSPLSASSLAQKLKVSRQAVVGDIALLRAQGHDIIATARGYLLSKGGESGSFIGKLVCKHSPEDTCPELYAIVDAGAEVLNVIVEHELYGEITGNLNLSRREDVDDFAEMLEAGGFKLLSVLTMGIHLHTIACRDRAHFQLVYSELDKKGFIFHSERVSATPAGEAP